MYIWVRRCGMYSASRRDEWVCKRGGGSGETEIWTRSLVSSSSRTRTPTPFERETENISPTYCTRPRVKYLKKILHKNLKKTKFIQNEPPNPSNSFNPNGNPEPPPQTTQWINEFLLWLLICICMYMYLKKNLLGPPPLPARTRG